MEGFEPAVTEVGHTPEEESDMGAKGEALAKQFEVKAHESWAYVEKLGDADLKKVTEAEKWTVAATAHHLFGAYDRVPDIAKGLVAHMGGHLAVDSAVGQGSTFWFAIPLRVEAGRTA